MSIVKNAINELLVWNLKYPPYGHEVAFYLVGKKEKTILMSVGLTNAYPIHLYIEKKCFSEEELGKLNQMVLKFSNDHKFVEFKGIRVEAELKLDRDYIENLITNIFKDVWGFHGTLEIRYSINPI